MIFHANLTLELARIQRNLKEQRRNKERRELLDLLRVEINVSRIRNKKITELDTLLKTIEEINRLEAEVSISKRSHLKYTKHCS